MKKRGIVSDYLIWLIIAVVVLVLFLIADWVLKDKGFAILDNIKQIFRRR
jgi:hypothetical protein